ncbi:MAG: peptidylprolyl isomerase [Lautropia sp.]
MKADLRPTARSILRSIGCAVVLGCAAGGALAQQTLASAQQPNAGDEGRLIDRVVAVVNQEAITQSELKARVALIEKQIEERRQVSPGADVLERQVLEQLIVDRLQLQYAKEAGVRPTEAEIDRALADIAQRNRVSLQGMRAQLAERGLSFNGYREQIASEITTLRLRDREARAKVSVSEAEIDAWLQKRGSLAQPEYQVGQILLKLDAGADPARVAEQMEKARQIAEQARGGAPFDALARQYSSAPDALQGGSLGWRGADRLPELFVQAVTPLAEGEVADPVRSPAGIHVLKLLAKRSGAATGAIVDQTHVRHILLPAASPTELAESTRRLEEFRRRIAAGESFESLARQFSIDGSAANGGDLGWMYAGETVPEFEAAMNALAPGEIGPPVRSQFGVHLVQVLERRKDQASPERLRALARQAVRDQKADEAFEQWLREQRERAYVEYRLENG